MRRRAVEAYKIKAEANKKVSDMHTFQVGHVSSVSLFVPLSIPLLSLFPGQRPPKIFPNVGNNVDCGPVILTYACSTLHLSPLSKRTVQEDKCTSSFWEAKRHVDVKRGLWMRAGTQAELTLIMVQVQQFFLLSQTDRLWKDHLQAMKFLQTAIGLRGYAQRVCDVPGFCHIAPPRG